LSPRAATNCYVPLGEFSLRCAFGSTVKLN
jgi:hypothetical protein